MCVNVFGAELNMSSEKHRFLLASSSVSVAAVTAYRPTLRNGNARLWNGAELFLFSCFSLLQQQHSSSYFHRLDCFVPNIVYSNVSVLPLLADGDGNRRSRRRRVFSFRLNYIFRQIHFFRECVEIEIRKHLGTTSLARRRRENFWIHFYRFSHSHSWTFFPSLQHVTKSRKLPNQIEIVPSLWARLRVALCGIGRARYAEKAFSNSRTKTSHFSSFFFVSTHILCNSRE